MVDKNMCISGNEKEGEMAKKCEDYIIAYYEADKEKRAAAGMNILKTEYKTKNQTTKNKYCLH